MKKRWMILVLALLLTGCAKEDYETVSDVYVTQPLPAMAEMTLWLPEEASVATFTSDDGSSLYLCGSYTVQTQVLPGGDLEKTVQTATGFSSGDLRILESKHRSLTRYSCGWSCAGGEGEQVGSAVILDDGSYHYVLTVLCQANEAGQARKDVEKVIASFSVSSQP